MDEIKKKIALDNKFKPEIKKMFEKMAKEYTQSIANGGNIADARVFNEDWVDMLKKHNDDVSSEFSGIVSQDLGAPTEEQALIIATAFDLLGTDRATSSAEEILTTTNQQIQMSLAENFLEDVALSVFVGEIVSRMGESRSSTIAMTETQYIAESTKNIEADGITNNPNTFLDSARLELGLGAAVYFSTPYQKQWNSALLPTTRDAHASAHLQKVSSDQSFFVGGEYLKHPGDMSQGASLGNVINCYCWTRYLKE